MQILLTTENEADSKSKNEAMPFSREKAKAAISRSEAIGLTKEKLKESKTAQIFKRIETDIQRMEEELQRIEESKAQTENQYNNCFQNLDENEKKQVCAMIETLKSEKNAILIQFKGEALKEKLNKCNCV